MPVIPVRNWCVASAVKWRSLASIVSTRTRAGVECGADAVDLGDVGAGERLHAEVAFADPSRACGETLERPRQLDRLHRGEARSRGDGAECQHEQDVELTAEDLSN